MKDIRWLTSVSVLDVCFTYHLKTATTEEIARAISILEANGDKRAEAICCKISVLSRELRRRKAKDLAKYSGDVRGKADGKYEDRAGADGAAEISM